jgi:hypothetical protein
LKKISSTNSKKPLVIDFDEEEKNQADNEAQENVLDMEREALIKTVDNKLIEADKNLEEIIFDLNKGKDIMQEINIEVRRQQEVFNKIQEQIKETYSLSKRSQKMINYFKRNMMTDKIFCSLIVLVSIAIIVIIILKFCGFKSKSSFNDVLNGK